MTRRLSLILSAMLLCVAAYAESAAGRLDACAKAIRNAPSLTAAYVAESAGGRSAGAITIAGDCFRAIGDNMSMWYDGKTLWSLDEGQKTCYVSEPTQQELIGVNPLAILDNLARGYTPSFGQKPKGAVELILKAKSGNEPFSRITLTIDNATSLPSSVVAVGPDGSRVTVRLSGYKRGSKLTGALFRYNSSERPSVEVVDMR